ncbi:MAG: hypothetical protein WCI57_04220 [Candidatus Berkelbacteria bacterium]
MAKEKMTVIDLRKKVSVKVTDKNPHAKIGTILEVHPIAAAKGVELGHYEMVKENLNKK